MPNWTINTLKAKGIGNLPIYDEDGEKKRLDFNKIIPMPKALDINKIMPEHWKILTMSNEAEVIIYYLTDHGKKMENLKGHEKILEDISQPYSPIGEEWIDNMIKRAKDCAQQEGEEEVYMLGKMYVDNFEKYGSIDCPNWLWKHWGTGSNACDCIVSEDVVDFITTWSPPVPVVFELSKQYPEITFIHGYTLEDEMFERVYDEDYEGVDYDGHMHEDTWKGGELVKDDIMATADTKLLEEEERNISNIQTRQTQTVTSRERNQTMNDTPILFYLLSYAGQQLEEGYCDAAVDAHAEEDAAIKRYDAAVLLIADIWVGGDVEKARTIVNDFTRAAETRFIEWTGAPLSSWKKAENFNNTSDDYVNTMSPTAEDEPLPFD